MQTYLIGLIVGASILFIGFISYLLSGPSQKTKNNWWLANFKESLKPKNYSINYPNSSSRSSSISSTSSNREIQNALRLWGGLLGKKRVKYLKI
jgi:hypothetical protein